MTSPWAHTTSDGESRVMVALASAIVTPPVGISLSCDSGARTSLMNVGPKDVDGKTLTMSAPASQASRISVGVKQPGIAGT